MTSRMQKNSTTEQAFLDAAEALFAEHGFEGTRVRAIAEASNANLGALHYYWGSKEALFSAVWKRRMEPLVQERRRFLEDLAARQAGEPTHIEELIAAWIEFGLGIRTEGGQPSEAFQRLYGRAITDPSPAVRDVVAEYFDESGKMLVQLLKGACPHLSDTEIYWRLHGLLGSILYAHIGRQRLDRIAVDLEAAKDMTEGARQMAHFVAAGFQARSIDRAGP